MQDQSESVLSQPAAKPDNPFVSSGGKKIKQMLVDEFRRYCGSKKSLYEAMAFNGK
jgi:hypothetical protein